jgi:V/A-type H+-transporting ATPase subunit E
LKEVDTGSEKVKKICDVLRRDTLEPAKQEAEAITTRAKAEAAQIIQKAQSEAEKIKTQANLEIEKERKIFTTSLQQASKQMLEALKNEIEASLFDVELSKLLNRPLGQKNIVVDLVKAVVIALEKDGIDADLDVFVPSSVSKQEINEVLLHQIGERLRSTSVLIGSMEGGVELKLKKENITIDITDEALREWVSRYVRPDFRKVLFGAN